MSRHPISGTCRDTSTGQVRSFATLSVYIAGGMIPASIYVASTGGTAVNSVVSDSNGQFLFYVDEVDYAITQLFKIVASKTGYDSFTYDNLPFFSLQCVDTDDTFTANSDKKIPSQKAVKTYIDTVVAGIEVSGGELPAATAENDFIVADGSYEWVKKTFAEVITILGLSDYVTKALFDANTILAATSDNTPVAVSVAEQTIVGRKAGGNIDDLSASDVKTLLNITEADLTTSNITTNNVSTSKHGLVPKAPNDTSKFLRGDGSWAVPTILISDGDKGDVTVSSSGTVWAVDNGAISQAKLKTSTGSVSTTTVGNYTLPGGEYGFYPQLQGFVGVTCLNSANQYIGSYKTNIYMNCYQEGGTAYARQRYVTSSGEVFWIFFLRDKATKKIIATWEAPDHPCMGNGGKPLVVAHPFPDYNSAIHEIIVVNPTAAEIKELESKRHVDKDDVPDMSLNEVINNSYEIDEKAGAPDWPTVPVTTGLPEGYDWVTAQEAKADSKIIKPIKKVILQPEYIITRTLRLK